jgi:hypothetical protein
LIDKLKKNNNMAKHTMTTQQQVRDSFWQFLKEVSPKLAAQKKTGKNNVQNMYCTDIRCSFVDYVDSLHRNGEISDTLANRVTL